MFRVEYLPKLHAFAGARELVRALKDAGFRMAVASSAKKQELLPLLRLAGAETLMDEKASGDDASDSKPDPDIVGVALERLRCAPDEAVMVGDTPYDLEAARKAGTACIAFRCGGWRDEELGGALAVYDGPRDLLDRLQQSPFARE